MLKKRVPTNCTAAASQSIRPGSHDHHRLNAARLRWPGPRWALIASWSCRNAAVVKKIDPMKNVIPMPGRVTDDHCDAIAATPKHVDPIANSTPIHQPM